MTTLQPLEVGEPVDSRELLQQVWCAFLAVSIFICAEGLGTDGDPNHLLQIVQIMNQIQIRVRLNVAFGPVPDSLYLSLDPLLLHC